MNSRARDLDDGYDDHAEAERKKKANKDFLSALDFRLPKKKNRHHDDCAPGYYMNPERSG